MVLHRSLPMTFPVWLSLFPARERSRRRGIAGVPGWISWRCQGYLPWWRQEIPAKGRKGMRRCMNVLFFFLFNFFFLPCWSHLLAYWNNTCFSLPLNIFALGQNHLSKIPRVQKVLLLPWLSDTNAVRIDLFLLSKGCNGSVVYFFLSF